MGSLLYRRGFEISILFLFFVVLGIAVFTEKFYLLALPAGALMFYLAWQQPRTIFFLLLAFIPFSVETQLGESLSTDFPDEILMIVLSIATFYYLANNRKYFSYLFSHPLIAFLLFWLLWISITVLLSGDIIISLKYLIAKGWYVIAFVFVPIMFLRDKNDLTRASKLIGVSMLIVTVIILARHSFDSFRFAFTNEAVTPFFRNHVNYGALLACLMPVFWAGLLLTGKKTSRSAILIAIVILIAALYFSYSRAAWFALIAGGLCWWLITRKAIIKAIVVVVFFVTGLITWLVSGDRYLEYAHDFNKTIYHENFSEHLIATYKLRDVSTAERFYRWVAGVRMVKDEPWKGYGPNRFYDNYKPYAIPAFQTWVSKNSDKSTVHNYYLLLVIEQGWPGLIFFLVLVIAAFFYAQRIYHRTNDHFYKIVAITTASILSIVLTLNFLSDLIETDKVGSIFFLCIGILVFADSRTRSFLSHSKHL